jgi:hypothetical protein
MKKQNVRMKSRFLRFVIKEKAAVIQGLDKNGAEKR